jgi:CBS-domain-containing membrane protein
MNDHHTARFFAALKLGWISRHISHPWEKSLYVFINGFISIAILATAAWVTGSPFVFPSLGPTAYLLYLTPLSAAASPRDCLLGHGIGILCGFGALLITGLAFLPESHAHEVTLPRVLAAALSLSATAGGMVLARVNHAPACATTLIISLGIITAPADLILIEFAVFLLVVQAFTLNRFAGIKYPVWALKS